MSVSPFRFVAIPPSRIGDRKKLKTASYLHDFLVDHQTDATGMVHYGRPISYAWVRAHWPGNPDERPPVRTLQRHMAALKRAGTVHVRVLGFGAGMVVRVLGSAKWQNVVPVPPQQLSLFAAPPIQISECPVENPVKKQRKSSVSQNHTPPNMAVVGRQMWRRKEVKNKAEETIAALAREKSMPRVEKTNAELEARRQLLLRQAVEVHQKYKRPDIEKAKATG